MKAFYTVHYEILLKKLDHMGIHGNVNKWFETFLTERRHSVALGDEKFSENITNIGVPQGAMLAPLLFLIYINDMFKCCPKLELIHYADDTTAFFTRQ